MTRMCLYAHEILLQTVTNDSLHTGPSGLGPRLNAVQFAGFFTTVIIAPNVSQRFNTSDNDFAVNS